MEHGQILRSLRETSEYSDLTVVCGSKTFKVHKCVVCLRSKWFAAACQEGRWKEGKEGVIELKAVESRGEDEDFSCDDPEAIAFMIDFIYLGDYRLGMLPVAEVSDSPIEIDGSPSTNVQLIDGVSFGPGKPCTKRKKHRFSKYPEPESEPEPYPDIGSPTGIAQLKGSLTMHTRLYALAVKYNLSDLKKVAIEKMKLAVRGTWDRADFAKAIAIAFGATPDGDRGMRDIIIQTILSCSANLVSDPAVEKAINAVDGLSFELFKLQSMSAKRKGY